MNFILLIIHDLSLLCQSRSEFAPKSFRCFPNAEPYPHILFWIMLTLEYFNILGVLVGALDPYTHSWSDWNASATCYTSNCWFVLSSTGRTDAQQPTIYGWVPTASSAHFDKNNVTSTVTSTMTILTLIDHKNITSLSTKMPLDYISTKNAAGTQVRTVAHVRFGETLSTVL